MIERMWGYNDRRDNRDLSIAANIFSLQEKTPQSLRTLIDSYLKIGEDKVVYDNLRYFIFDECEGYLSHKIINTIWDEELSKINNWCIVC